ncbi:MAG TPA: PDZ domain-containing protein, partial [Bacteroidetes bacterium]|nr:PDZ domain-containing protein [Bacteroidota bacterium]
MSRKQQYFLVVILILASVSFGGWLANSAGVANPDIYLSIKKNFELFQKIYQEITFQYVDEVDPYAFIKAGIEGMTQKLDPYTGYIEKEENENLAVLTKGKYGGVGMSISKRGDYPTVVEPPFENTPAGRAGIREGDKIVEVAGKETKDESLSKIAERLRGKKGTAVKIKIKRADEKKRLDFRLIRDIIVVQDIQYADFIKDNIGYVRLTRFSKNSAKQFRKAITDLKKKGMKGLILDLRSNPGGLLDAAVEISDLILPRGELIVYTKGRTANSNRKYYSSKDPPL